MQTIEVSYVNNRRKEKINADVVSFTDAPGWVVVKTDGAVTEMLPANAIKRLKFLTKATLRLADDEPSADHLAAMQPQLLRLPTRQEALQRQHIYTPLLNKRS